MVFETSRERALIELFGALEGRYGPNYECKYYPCHFEGQDCSLCFCPFYPCFIYDLGYIKKTTKGYVWNCKECNWIHEKDVVEEVLSELSSYSRQQLVEEGWLFFNRIVQKLYYGRELGKFIGNAYSLIGCMEGKECEEIEDIRFLAVRLENFEISDVEEMTRLQEFPEGVILIPLLDGDYLFGFKLENNEVKGIKCRLF
ncbi:MAG: hypothetical protein DSY33_06155 [Archaeoglobus sp.]|jgi:Zn-finger protein|nr:MAG: hypothetical protein DSY33_06155 [Archaeoglobus sp.]